MMLHDDFCPCHRLNASLDFCNCGAGADLEKDLSETYKRVSQRLSGKAPSKTGWVRKRGIDRRPGHRRLNRWTVDNAHKFASTRLNDIEALLAEIAGVYEDVDQYLVNECEDLINRMIPELREAIDQARTEGRTP